MNETQEPPTQLSLPFRVRKRQRRMSLDMAMARMLEELPFPETPLQRTYRELRELLLGELTR